MQRKQEVKLLILSDLADFNEKEVLEELNELKRRHFDVVVVMGKVDNTVLLGYGSRHYNPKGVDIDKIPEYGADVLFSYHAPMRINENENYKRVSINTEEINRYGAFRNPLRIFHGERKQNKTTVLSNGTEIISCYGIVPYILTYYKEIEDERKDEKNR